MNANQTQKHSKQNAKLNLSLVPMEKAEPPTIWQRMKKAFAKSPAAGQIPPSVAT